MHFLYLCLCLILYFGRSSPLRTINLTDETLEETIECCDDDEIVVRAGDDFQILVTVEAFDIPYDHQSGVHYLLVKSGADPDDGLDGRIFTHYIRTPREYLSMKNEVYLKLAEIPAEDRRKKVTADEPEPTEAPKPVGEFLVKFRRFGDEPTTTELTTTEIPWPTPSEDESANITVNISGKTPGWYTEGNLKIFREKVAEMAIKYCGINNITSTEEISIDNVFVDNVIQCPINWPGRKDCVQITFRVPIFQEPEMEYQLNTEHLNIMWARYSNNFLEPEFTNYGTPQTSIFTLWLIIICATILVFSVILYLFKRFSHKLAGINKRKKSVAEDQDNILYTKAPRNDSLNPHPKQIVPGMFESENQYYDPDATDNIIR